MTLINTMKTYESARLQVVGYRAIQGTVSDLLHGHGINTSQWILLGSLYEKPAGMRISDMANILAVEKPLITALLRSLTDQKLVDIVSEKQDKRAKTVTLTALGREQVPHIEQELHAALTQFEKAVTPEVLKTYFKALERFIAATQPEPIKKKGK